MDAKQKLDLMMERFAHDGEPFAQQVYVSKEEEEANPKKKQGTYFYPERRGDCNHNPKHTKLRECDGYVEIPFETKHLRKHLKGEKTYAPYQISKEGTIKWICFDVDSYNEVSDDIIQETTKMVAKSIYDKFGPNSFLVETSGSKGYHLWLFFDSPIAVGQGYALGHELTQMITTNKDINIEIYPKQQTNNTLFGNTVKIPLGIHQKTGNRCLFVNSSFNPHEDQWAALANVKLISAEWVKSNVEVRAIPTTQHELGGSSQYPSYYPLCLSEILESGCREGVRDEAAFREAAYLSNKGIPLSLGEPLLYAWNKRNTPPMDEVDLDIKIEQGYNGNYSWKPCHLNTFDEYCHSSCFYFEKKVERRWYTKDKSPIGVISRD